MRSLKLMTFASAIAGAISLAPLAHAQTRYVPDGLGIGREPVSSRASNILSEDSGSAIAPALPTPPVGPDAGPHDYLRAARHAIASGRTGEAQQSLEMAETRVLTRVVTPDAASAPDPDPAVSQIRDALHALGEGDRARALQIIDAMAN